MTDYVKTHFELAVLDVEHSIIGVNCDAECGQQKFRVNSVFRFVYKPMIDKIEHMCVSHHVRQIVGEFPTENESFAPCGKEWENSHIRRELYDRAVGEAERIFVVTGSEKLLKSAQKVSN